MNEKYSYEDFWKAVKDDLRSSLSAWNLSDEQIEEFMRREEDEIQNGFHRYRENIWVSEGMTEDAKFKADVSAVGYCLYMLY